MQVENDDFCEDSLDILLINAYNGKGGSSKTSTSEEFRDSYEVSMIASHSLLQNALFYLTQWKRCKRKCLYRRLEQNTAGHEPL